MIRTCILIVLAGLVLIPWRMATAEENPPHLEGTAWSVPLAALTTNVSLPAGSSWQFVLGTNHQVQVMLVTPMGNSKTTMTASWNFNGSILTLNWPGQSPSERTLTHSDGSGIDWQKRNGEQEHWAKMNVSSPSASPTQSSGVVPVATSSSVQDQIPSAIDNSQNRDPAIYTIPEGESLREIPPKVLALVPVEYQSEFAQYWIPAFQGESPFQMYEKVFDQLFRVVSRRRLEQLEQSGATQGMSADQHEIERAKVMGYAQHETRAALPFPDGYVEEVIKKGAPSPVVVDSLPFHFQGPFLQAWRLTSKVDPGTPNFQNYEKAHQALEEVFLQRITDNKRAGKLKLSDTQRLNVKASLQQIADLSATKLMPPPPDYEAAKESFLELRQQQEAAEEARQLAQQKSLTEEQQRQEYIVGCFAFVLLIEFGALFVWMIFAFSNRNHPHLKTDTAGKKYCPAMRAIEEARLARYKVRFPAPVQNQKRPSSSVDEIERLVALRDKGVLTQAEFESQKSKILSS